MWTRGVSTMKEGGKTIYAPHYFRWRGMRNRCSNTKNSMYYLYGGRGISVCDEWQDFWAFYDWCMSTHIEGCSIDRINPNGNYSPDNCRWSTPHEQQLNARLTENKKNATRKALGVLKENPRLRTKGNIRCVDTGKFMSKHT